MILAYYGIATALVLLLALVLPYRRGERKVVQPLAFLLLGLWVYGVSGIPLMIGGVPISVIVNIAICCFTAAILDQRHAWKIIFTASTISVFLADLWGLTRGPNADNSYAWTVNILYVIELLCVAYASIEFTLWKALRRYGLIKPSQSPFLNVRGKSTPVVRKFEKPLTPKDKP